MTKYEELSAALAAWNKAVNEYSEESIGVVVKFLNGLVAYLGVTSKEIAFFPPPGERVKPNTIYHIMGSRYPSDRDGYAFTPALIIKAPNGSPIYFHIPVEYHKATIADAVYTLKVFDTDYTFSDVDAKSFESVYAEVVETIRRNFEKAMSPKSPLVSGYEN